MNFSIALLVASLIAGIGGWMVTLASWSVALTTINLGGLLVILAGVVVAWLGKSPIKPNTP
jgi:hypothetical protein